MTKDLIRQIDAMVAGFAVNGEATKTISIARQGSIIILLKKLKAALVESEQQAEMYRQMLVESGCAVIVPSETALAASKGHLVEKEK